MSTPCSAWLGVGTQNRQGAWLEVFTPPAQPIAELVAAIAPILGYSEGNQAIAFTTTQALQLAEALKASTPPRPPC
jgi:2,3,4,5-tetrahydropyridine-2-carboxylate N-succinyltransferase